MIFLSAYFFSKFTFSLKKKKICLEPDEDRRSFGPDMGPNLCKGYQQTTKVAASKERVNLL